MKLTVAAIALLLSSTVAFAADLSPQTAEPMAPVESLFSWTGFYAGAQIGYGHSSSHEALYEANRGRGMWAQSKLNPEGAIGGLYAGYNYDFSSGLVIGADADFTLSGMKNKSPLFVYATDALGPRNAPGDADRSRVLWTAAAGGRVGYAIDRFMPYIAGGIAFAKFSDLGTHTYVDFRYETTRVGWTVGGGLDYALTDNLILRAEYRYSHFGDIGGMTTITPQTQGYEQHVDYNLSINDVRLGIAYKF
jgi:outer membrane immunogenic protein